MPKDFGIETSAAVIILFVIRATALFMSPSVIVGVMTAFKVKVVQSALS